MTSPVPGDVLLAAAPLDELDEAVRWHALQRVIVSQALGLPLPLNPLARPADFAPTATHA